MVLGGALAMAVCCYFKLFGFDIFTRNRNNFDI